MESYTGLDEKTLNWELNEASMSVVNSNSLGDCGHTSVSLSFPVIAKNTNLSLASQGSRGWENQMDKNVPICCPQNRFLLLLLFFAWNLVSFSMRGTITWRYFPCSFSLFFLQIVETLFNALNQNLVQFELKPGVQVIVYVTQLTLGKCLEAYGVGRWVWWPDILKQRRWLPNTFR